jgi:hypothetical protein
MANTVQNTLPNERKIFFGNTSDVEKEMVSAPKRQHPYYIINWLTNVKKK